MKLNTVRCLEIAMTALFLATAAAHAQEKPAPEPVTVIRAGRLLDPVSGEVRSNQVIVVRGNRISDVLSETAGRAIPWRALPNHL